MRLLVVFCLLLGTPFPAAAGGSDGSNGECARRCGDTIVPYPFGFSGGCPVILSCDASTSTALLPRSTAVAPPYPILSFSAVFSTFKVSMASSCNRTVGEARASLTGAGFGVSNRTGLFLAGGCRTPGASNCSISTSLAASLLRAAGCAAGGGDSWTCVAQPPAYGSAAGARGQGWFLDWGHVDAAGCEDAVTATAYGEPAAAGSPSLDFGVAEMTWWVNGTCAVAAAAAGVAGRCAANAACDDVQTPGGAWGHQCYCPNGMSGDGFAAGEGCHYGGSPSRRRGKLSAAAIAGIVVAAAASFAAFFLSVCFCLRRRKRRLEMKISKQPPRVRVGARLFRGRPTEGDLELEDEVAGPQRFSYEELVTATDNFSDDRRLGRGGFGSVYAGLLTLTDGTHRDVAVKRVSETSRQGWKEFASEVRIISRLRHRNLVQLIGWCHGAGDCNDELLLVYELMRNGSLDAHLYDGDPEHVLTWPVRYKIALGIGSALLYLHEEAERRVVHRDIKPSNVMLDAAFVAKLGDFGLARLIDDGRQSRTTAVAGTMGYMDPESVLAGRVDVTSDVYSFGVLLLEIASGRRPAVLVRGEEEDDDDDHEFIHLASWVWNAYGGGGAGAGVLAAADARLAGEFDGREMEAVMVVGLWCAHPDRGARPTIRQAVSALRFEAAPPSLPAKMPVATYGPLPVDRPDDTTTTTTASGGSSASIWHSSTTEPSFESSLMKWPANNNASSV
ncbi:unnamed protein product [Urochloa humidicola]